LTYLVLGILGAPVFAGGNSGWQYFIGPSLGYFLGFLLSPLVISGKALSPFSPLEVFVWQLVGIFFILTLGTLRLAFLVASPLESGFSPFLLPAVIKAVLATGLLYLVSGTTRRQ
jgi:biotin transport system substrate-specific component